MKLVHSFVTAVLMLTAVQSLAAERWHTSTIKFVHPLSNGDFVFAFDTDPATCTNANAPKYLYVTVGQNGMTSAGSVKLYAAVMTALTTRQTVTVNFDDATTGCYVNRLVVNN
jgi:hypothetical protein